MFKKIFSAIFITCISASSYAYVIPTNFSIENKTNVDMTVEITPAVKGQEKITKQIPAHDTLQISLDNGDHSGWLYQTSTSPFIIKANGKPYVQGRIAYYVGASVGNKYSFLNAVTSADGVKVNPIYSCRNGGSNPTFENKIIIDGTPENALKLPDFPDEVSCQGIKYSHYDMETQDYNVTCSDDTYSTFHQLTDYFCFSIRIPCWWRYSYSNGEQSYKPRYPEKFPDAFAYTDELNATVGKGFCATW